MWSAVGSTPLFVRSGRLWLNPKGSITKAKAAASRPHSIDVTLV